MMLAVERFRARLVGIFDFSARPLQFLAWGALAWSTETEGANVDVPCRPTIFIGKSLFRNIATVWKSRGSGTEHFSFNYLQGKSF